ncbi:putative ATP synthase subunit f, mitochondrial [Anthonomus grandis grandis]|uniref:putative ATP synthase subunit f, mitochondrial n=1 Tax=Anthonomus grandis grandis TaxID=2921223 RepID=UPI00216509BD|nr:putative ATP synthase subunit f, mitochondrial [Anthonomus grandis grandis]
MASWGFGDYPPEYNPKVHGPYDPARYYGKADVPFGQVKLGEIGGWLARRNKNPRALVSAVSRAYWRWSHKYVQPKRAGIAPFLQVLFGAMGTFYFLNYHRISQHRNYKYH